MCICVRVRVPVMNARVYGFDAGCCGLIESTGHSMVSKGLIAQGLNKYLDLVIIYVLIVNA